MSKASKKPATPKPLKPAVVSLNVGAAAVLPALLLAAPALVEIDPVLLEGSAVALLGTAASVALGAALGGGARRDAASNVGPAMLGALGGLLLVGFPLFMVFEPVWWRFAAGMVGPLLVAAAVAYGAPRKGVEAESTVQGTKRWLMEPLELMRSMLQSLLGRDGGPSTTPASRR